MLSNKFSRKYRKLLLLRHFISAFIVFFVLFAVFLGIKSVGNNNFYIFVEKVAGYDFAWIEIYASQTLSYITVSIKNYGKTIPADELGHIFDKFYRSKEYGESEESGTGLGLAIAKEIVRIHNGSIYAMSDDEITVFEVKLPVAEKQR